jgi:hypothetical protein
MLPLFKLEGTNRLYLGSGIPQRSPSPHLHCFGCCASFPFVHPVLCLPRLASGGCSTTATHFPLSPPRVLHLSSVPSFASFSQLPLFSPLPPKAAAAGVSLFLPTAIFAVVSALLDPSSSLQFSNFNCWIVESSVFAIYMPGSWRLHLFLCVCRSVLVVLVRR